MSCPFTKEQIASLKVFVNLCLKNPEFLNFPALGFVKEFIEHFGGKIPADVKEEAGKKTEAADSSAGREKGDENSDDAESDIELDNTGVVESDNDPPQKMGNLSLQPTEDEIAESQSKRSEAVSAFVEKDYERALALYTEAIMLNPHAALLYAKRGQVYVEMKKPNACIRDCNKALELNSDSAVAHKFRGRANQLLGNWEEAANDLRLACQFDFDEQADVWLREVTPNARKIEEHKRKKERNEAKKAERARQEAARQAHEAAAARDANSCPSQTDDAPDKSSMGDFFKYLNDPEILEAFQDPVVSAAFVDISSNPANILKYQCNPKVMDFINKVASKFGRSPGMMGGGPGGIFGGGGVPGATPKPSTSKNDDDVGLD